MSALNKLVGQVLLEVARAPQNTGFVFSEAVLGVYSPFTGTLPEALIGKSVTGVREVENKVLEVQFQGDGALVIDLSGPQVECYSLRFRDGPIVVG
jgi:hypothetical protein